VEGDVGNSRRSGTEVDPVAQVDLISKVDPIDAAFLRVVAENTAGDPMNAKVRWTNLSARQIVAHLKTAGLNLGRRAVRRLLKRHGYRRRKATKDRVMGNRPGRNEQFLNIARLKAEYLHACDPVISIDTKKRELIGNFFRPGTLYTTDPVKVFDHDFPSFAKGVVIPHGVYDLARNTGHITLGTSHDTSEFACDSVRLWWQRQGKAAYPNAKRLLILCDGGGSNSASRYLFKEQLQRLADELGLEIRIAHYPPYCSKYNPIEHRLFPHVTRACAGVIFHSVELVKQLVQRTSTKTGLSVTVDVLESLYQTGLKVAVGFKKKMRIVFDAFLPKWNYRAVPTGG
jgi:Rhodopirellula transposase DDE domain